MEIVQQAYDCLLWWKYHQSISLWANYCKAKYGCRDMITTNIYNSAIWKRLCRIHDYMHHRVQYTPDGILWTAPFFRAIFHQVCI